jgi:AraC-like DNA-binding protein
MAESSPVFGEYAIPQRLRPFVTSIWSLENRGAPNQKSRERILPDGCVELVLHFRNPFRNYFADGRSNMQPPSFVVGQMQRFLDIEPSGSTGFVAVRLHARGAYMFFRSPLTAITNSVVPLNEIWNARADECTERVALARRMPERLRIVEEMLIEALQQNGRRDCTVDRCIQLIQEATQPVAITQLASTLGLSSRQLTRRFENTVGMSPKEFLRVNRFIRAARRIRRQGDSSLTETAYECAYFDQAHFNHEFRALAGITPGEFMAAKNVAV